MNKNTSLTPLSTHTDMYVKRHEFFRWTPKTAWLTVTYVVAVPAAFVYMAFATEVGYSPHLNFPGTRE